VSHWCVAQPSAPGVHTSTQRSTIPRREPAPAKEPAIVHPVTLETSRPPCMRTARIGAGAGLRRQGLAARDDALLARAKLGSGLADHDDAPSFDDEYILVEAVRVLLRDAVGTRRRPLLTSPWCRSSVRVFRGRRSAS